MAKDNVRPLTAGGVVLQKPQEARRFMILITGATDGDRLALAPVQLSGIGPLEAQGILAHVRIGAPAQMTPEAGATADSGAQGAEA